MKEQLFNRIIWISFVGILVLFGIAMFTMDLMNIDSSQYASISKDMFFSGNYLEVYCRGDDYLDKPPLVFWLACLSFKLFGVQDWAFRLPSVLVLALGVYSLYRFARLYYDIRVAKLAALLMAGCVASYCMVTDVRTDTMLTGWVMFSLWQLAEFYSRSKLKNILLAAFGIAMAMLTKGPIGLVVPVIAFACEFVYKRQWKNFVRWQYLPALVVIGLLLLPMSYGLYMQFDLHPEKNVYNMQGPSGLRFFYWTQSFGRITGESYWDNNPDPFFLYHSFLWSFMPWTVFFIPAYYQELKEKIKGFGAAVRPEIITISGFTLILFFLSRSKYQLPHYTFLIHPLAALITARYLCKLIFEERAASNKFNIVKGFQYFSLSLAFALCAVIMHFVFVSATWHGLLWCIPLLMCVYIVVSKKIAFIHKTLTVSIISIITVYAMLTWRFYPELFKYQSDWAIAKDVNLPAAKNTKTIEWYTTCGYAFDFYCKTPVRHYYGDIRPLVKDSTFVIVEKEYLAQCQRENPGITVIRKYDDFSVTQLTGEFLNPLTRSSTLRTKYLLKY